MAPPPEDSGQEVLALDPALGNADAARLRLELQKGEWGGADTLLEGLRDWDARAFFVGALADWEGRPAWLDAWYRARGRASPAPALVRGAHSINWAWQARGSGTGDKVGADAASLFLARLQNAERDLEQAAMQDPDDPTPWALLVVTAMGRSAGDAVMARRFDQAVRRDPDNRAAHARRLVSLAEKWGGSHDAMFGFAREAAGRAPAGSSLHSLVPWAHVERWLAFAMARDQAGWAGYLLRSEVRAEILDSCGRLLGAPPAAPHWEAADRNVLAFALWKCGEKARAAEQLEALGTRVTLLPWGLLGDPVRRFVEARAECTGRGEEAVERRMAELAQKGVALALEMEGKELDFSWESLSVVEGILARSQGTLAGESDAQRRNAMLAAIAPLFGAYVGEAVRRRFGGCWIRRAEGNEPEMPTLLVREAYGNPIKLVITILTGRAASLREAVGQWVAEGPASGAGTGPIAPATPAAAGSPAAGSMRAEAEVLVQAARRFGVGELRYDEASLSLVDAFLPRLREGLSTLKGEELKTTGALLGVRLGAYLGETLCRVRGGAWRDDVAGVPAGIPAVDLGGLVALTIPASFGLLTDGATALGEVTARTATEYYQEAARRQKEWLNGRLCGSGTLEELAVALSEDPALARELVDILGTAILTGAVKWGLQLDFSEASLEGLDNLLEELHKPIASGAAADRPTDEQIATMATVWGVYLGEVIRRQRGGRWSWTEVPRAGRVLRVGTGARSALPVSRVERRIREGASRSVREFFHWIGRLEVPGPGEGDAARPSEALAAFVSRVGKTALGFVPSGEGAMAPFLFFEKDDGHTTLTSFVAMAPGKAVALGRRHAAALPPEVRFAAVVCDGYVSEANEKKKDAILIEAHERGVAWGFQFGQRYHREADGSVAGDGEGEEMGRREPLLGGTAA